MYLRCRRKDIDITYINVNTRERLSPEESRAAALEAARALLIEQGPQAVTLKAVAAEIGKTHANLLHHFGSAAGLQAALAELISDRVCAGIEEAVQRARAHEADPIEIVDRVFDAFGTRGRRRARRLDDPLRQSRRAGPGARRDPPARRSSARRP